MLVCFEFNKERDDLSFDPPIALLACFEFNKERGKSFVLSFDLSFDSPIKREDLSFDSPIAVLLACLLSFDSIRLLCFLDSN